MSVIEALRVQIRQYETAHAVTSAALPFGVPEIDTRLPGGGLRLGALHEVADGGTARCSASAGIFASGILARLPGPVMWCVSQRDLFAPALALAGLDADRIVFVEAGDETTLLACFEEGLRHGSMAGVVGEVSKMSMTASRRLQLAAESSGAVGIALWRWPRKGKDIKPENTAAHTSWRITALPSTLLPVMGVGRGKWRLELMRCRGGERAEFDVEACDEKGNIAIFTVLDNRQDAEADGQGSTVIPYPLRAVGA